MEQPAITVKTVTTLMDVIYRVTHGAEIDIQNQAKYVGRKYSTYANSCNKDIDPEARPPFRAEDVVPISLLLGDFRILDFMEFQAGRQAFLLPQVPACMEDIQGELAKAVKEFGDVLTEVSRSLSPESENGTRLSANEVKAIEKEILEEVQQLMALLDALKRTRTES